MRQNVNRNQADIQEQWWRSPGFLYFIGAGDPAIAVRVGLCAKSAFTRKFRKMQRYNHEQLRISGVIPFTDGKYPMKDCEIAQNRIHVMFSELQKSAPGTSGAEWFAPDPKLLEFIQQNADEFKNV